MVTCAFSSGGGSANCANLNINIPSPAIVGGAMIYIASLFILCAGAVCIAAAVRLRRLAVTGDMPPAVGDPSGCAACLPSIPAINGLGASSVRQRRRGTSCAHTCARTPTD